jgi:hypothetical protein
MILQNLTDKCQDDKENNVDIIYPKLLKEMSHELRHVA